MHDGLLLMLNSLLNSLKLSCARDCSTPKRPRSKKKVDLPYFVEVHSPNVIPETSKLSFYKIKGHISK